MESTGSVFVLESEGVVLVAKGCRVLGKVLGELRRRLGKPLAEPNRDEESA
jgi:hypothetical protein